MTRRRALWVALGAGLGLAAAGCSQAGTDDGAVSVDFARTEHEAGRAILVDIREPTEHATGVAAGARLLPMRQLGARIGEMIRARLFS